MTDAKKEIEELRAEVAALKTALSGKEEPPPKSTFVPMTDAEHRDWVHQMNERRMSLASNFHPDDLRAMEAACPPSAVKDIVAHGTVPSPGNQSVIPSSQHVSAVRGGSSTGYRCYGKLSQQFLDLADALPCGWLEERLVELVGIDGEVDGISVRDVYRGERDA